MNSKCQLRILVAAPLACFISYVQVSAAPNDSKASALANNTKDGLPLLPPYAPWPANPLKKLYLPVTEGSWIGMDEPAFSRPPEIEKQLQLFDTPAGMSSVFGCLVHTGDQYKIMFYEGKLLFPTTQDYLFLEGRGDAFDELRKQGKGAVRYHFKTAPPLRTLRFPEQGRNILFGSGYNTDRLDGWGFYNWNLSSNRLTVARATSRNIYYEAVSPDGNEWAVVGYDDDQQEPQDPSSVWKNVGAGWLELSDLNATYGFHELDDTLGIKDKTLAPPGQSRATGKPVWRVSNAASRRPPHWGLDGRVFYTHEPQVQPRHNITSPKNLPEIWVADGKDKTNKSVLVGGYDGVPSPDGRFLAFFGYTPKVVPSETYPAMPPQLYLYEFKTGKISRLSSQNTGQVMWAPDSKTLVTIAFPEDRYHAHVQTIPIQPVVCPAKEVAVVEAEDPVGLGDGRGTAAITPMHISRNGRYLILQRDELAKLDYPVYDHELWMQAVDLQSGVVTILAHATPIRSEIDFSWDWFDVSDAPFKK